LSHVYSDLDQNGTSANMLDQLTELDDLNSLIGLDRSLKLEEDLMGANKSAEEKLHVRIRGKTKPA